MGARSLSEAVIVDHLHKWYRVYAAPSERIKRFCGRSSRHLDFRALDDISFTIERGTAVGIVGENGAGKSTLLKIIAGTTEATLGTVSVNGVVAAILELGAAFHPEFTGRENAILYGALMGLDRADMTARLPDVIDFAELGDFIDQPIKSYSTGMVMRLAFAVATNVDPDVLVIDEALAVGDGYFQKKCIDRIRAIKERGTTILFCSHAMYYVSLFCDRVLWIKSGRVERDGPAQEVVTAYEEFLVNREKRRLESEPEDAMTTPAPRGTQVVIRAIRLLDGDGRELQGYTPGEGLTVEIDWESADPESRQHVGVAIERGDGTRVLGVTTFWDGHEPVAANGVRTTRLVVDRFPVAKGEYSVTAYIFDASGLHIWDQVVLGERLQPASSEWAPALLEVDHRWETEPR